MPPTARRARCAGPLLDAAGADVVVIHAEPDGRNINAGCGATDTASLAAAVVRHGADLGVALDGDADRLMAVDHTGALVDGDHVIAVCALDLHGRGLLRDGTVVVTVMTNLGFRLAMEDAGIHVVETAVGDRYVLEALDAGGLSLGGEQSGHVIFRDLATTGDGLLTAVILSTPSCAPAVPLAELAAAAMTTAAAGAAQRAGRRRRCPTPPSGSPPRSRPSRPSSATTAGSWCVRAAPSRSCG